MNIKTSLNIHDCIFLGNGCVKHPVLNKAMFGKCSLNQRHAQCNSALPLLCYSHFSRNKGQKYRKHEITDGHQTTRSNELSMSHQIFSKSRSIEYYETLFRLTLYRTMKSFVEDTGLILQDTQ